MNKVLFVAWREFSATVMTKGFIIGVLMTPLWIDGQLVLARRVTAGGQEYVQGCLLDWPAMKTSARLRSCHVSESTAGALMYVLRCTMPKRTNSACSRPGIVAIILVWAANGRLVEMPLG